MRSAALLCVVLLPCCSGSYEKAGVAVTKQAVDSLPHWNRKGVYSIGANYSTKITDFDGDAEDDSVRLSGGQLRFFSSLQGAPVGQPWWLFLHSRREAQWVRAFVGDPRLKIEATADGELMLGWDGGDPARTGLLVTKELFDWEEGQLGALSITSIEDINADSVPELLVGIPETEGADQKVGTAALLSGLSASVLHEFVAPDDAKRFGEQVSGIGDFDGNGDDDLLVCAPGVGFGGGPSHYSTKGKAFVFSSESGSLLKVVEGWEGGDNFGSLCGRVPDLNGDGVKDVALGTRRSTFNSSHFKLKHGGYLLFLCGQTLELIDSLVNSDRELLLRRPIGSFCHEYPGIGELAYVGLRGEFAIQGARKYQSSAILLLNPEDLSMFGLMGGDLYSEETIVHPVAVPSESGIFSALLTTQTDGSNSTDYLHIYLR